MTKHPPGVDLSREPFADDGIDTRVLGQSLARNFDPDTGEILHDRRQRGPGADVSRSAWPPPSGGPLPPRETLRDLDLNIFTAQDEIDAWAHEHDRATNALIAVRRLLVGEGDTEGVEEEYARLRAHYRRQARKSPVERGRRTAEDITEEVTELLIAHGVWRRVERLRNEVDEATTRLFRAKDNISRLDAYVRSLPRVSDRP